ncbi:hypothetical protein NA57DRAFT_55319 [Rhizodiscina lignyota]|uniref:Uncharacterized protein n=1 Tax=Rhizodiscina lignyota TaxID=1504668 RepID=A0A9P4IG21_9PEZI|nr:hypothetical protein NA57DRAFT_55319 [Rhizodiscina lignyota]
MPFTVLLALLTLLGTHAASTGYDGLSKKCPSSNSVLVRPPPTLDIKSPANEKWIPAPIGFTYGHWWVTHSSNPAYFQIANFQYDSYPVFPSGSYPGLPSNANINASNPPTIDLVSWNSINTSNPEIFTGFGYDYLRSDVPNVINFRGTGRLSEVANSLEMLAWGFDTDSVEWFVTYETTVPPSNATSGYAACLDINYRKKNGPRDETYSAIIKAIKDLCVPHLTTLAKQTRVLPTDNRRDGLPPVACDEACVENAIIFR